MQDKLVVLEEELQIKITENEQIHMKLFKQNDNHDKEIGELESALKTAENTYNSFLVELKEKEEYLKQVKQQMNEKSTELKIFTEKHKNLEDDRQKLGQD
jgi:CRISPR/Cas system CMR-associated protein Cmr5 small subunit